MCRHDGMSQLELADWEEDGTVVNNTTYDTALLGNAVDVDTENVICSRLVPDLCESRDITALRQLVSTISEIPEHYLADMIFTALSSDSSEAGDTLDEMLRRPYTPATMTSVLHQRHLLDVVQLLDRVAQRLQTAEADFAEVLLDWLTVLLDSQYASLVLSDAEEVIQLLERVTRWRNRQEESARDATLLLRALDRIKALQKDPPSPPAADYCVETLQL